MDQNIENRLAYVMGWRPQRVVFWEINATILVLTRKNSYTFHALTFIKFFLSYSIVSIPVSLKQGANAPSYAMDGDAGMDLRAFLEQPVTLHPGQRILIPTGLSMAIPRGHEGQVRPRSGLALKEGLTVLNSPGTIDSGYRGEIKVILINLGQKPATVSSNDRIAQIIIAPICSVQWKEIDALPPAAAARGSGGFGSSGKE